MSQPVSSSQGFEHFITVRDGMLMQGDAPYRFISFNVPNLHFIEDDMRFAQVNPYRLPDAFEMRDVFATIREMGGQALRIYAIPVRNAAFPPDAPSYVLGPGQFSEEAFCCLDRMLALANAYGVRIIVPLVNNWQWMGGRQSYAAFRGREPDAFWTDRQIIDDFKAMIHFLLMRINTVTGQKYADDKAILCWETGNELFAPPEWTIEIARYIKSLDPNHLVMDGSRGDFSNQQPSIQAALLDEPAIDIVTTHHYEDDPALIPQHIENVIRQINRRKAYLIGEFGFASATTIVSVLDRVIDRNRDVAGALIWCLRFRNREGGFYWHTEPLSGLYKALHWPGFPSGQSYDETRLMMTVRRKAFEIRRIVAPGISVPEAPYLLPIDSPTTISWQGAMGATSYIVERAPAASGPWECVGPNVGDDDVPYFPLFNDTTVRVGGRYYYRVSAMNSAGVSSPSNCVGPVEVHFKAKIDRMKSLDEVVYSAQVSPVTGGDRSFKEIRNRIAGGAGAEMVYSVPGRFQAFALYAFEQFGDTGLRVLGSSDGSNWSDLHIEPETFTSAETNYDYWRPKLYRFQGGNTVKFLKIHFNATAQLARVEIIYTNR